MHHALFAAAVEIQSVRVLCASIFHARQQEIRESTLLCVLEGHKIGPSRIEKCDGVAFE
jgi:hypothetical protein